MLLISDKIRALTTLLCPLAFGCSRGGILLWALAFPRTEAFFLTKPLQLAGISVASGMVTLTSGKETTFRKFDASS